MHMAVECHTRTHHVHAADAYLKERYVLEAGCEGARVLGT
jgi:hypothetical protein